VLEKTSVSLGESHERKLEDFDANGEKSQILSNSIELAQNLNTVKKEYISWVELQD